MDRIATLDLQDLFAQERQYINHFFDHLDFSEMEKVLHLCLQCQGLLILVGVGKSGIIAEKIATTLSSTGTRAFCPSVTNLLHGDMGMITKEDLIIIFSKSGETKELLELMPHFRQKENTILAITSNNTSRLAQAADHCMQLSVEKELCPFDLAPTISTTVQLIFGDVLAMALMKEKEISLEEYAENHPSGSIGKKGTLLVADLMKKGEEIPLCSLEDELVDVIVELSNKKCGCLLVVSKEKHLLGIFTDGDLRRALQKEGAEVMKKQMQELMNPHPITICAEDLAYKALEKMQEKHYVMMAPVIQEEKVIGLIRMHDIIHEGIDK